FTILVLLMNWAYSMHGPIPMPASLNPYSILKHSANFVKSTLPNARSALSLRLILVGPRAIMLILFPSLFVEASAT
ncbi:MAG: hypothetical protein QXV17_02580, partial [Candidatus Micrarchaeaceae archaeon]